MSKYDDLVKKLKEIFQIDQPELDFGIYRILNARAGEINDYLSNRLKAKVGESLSAHSITNLEGMQKELKDKETQYRADGIDPATVPKVLELRQKIAETSTDTFEQENAVFTHLLTFFSRYYDKGDFISQRRYKGDTYAIPYAGEEVVLYWANKDQYYTKSGENFSNYTFKIDDGRSVHFRLVTADTAKDNRKDNDSERRFVLIEPGTRILTDDEGDECEEEILPVQEVPAESSDGQDLVLHFEYKAMPKGSRPDTLVLEATNKVLNDRTVKARWLALSKREPTEKNPQRTLLEKHLINYTTKNSSDYFIHKDLGRFLRRELDFYIKTEVMQLDDVQNAEKFVDIEKNLRLIQTLRGIAHDLIAFLAQLEDFQKKLWLKKKFVVATYYCMTLDRVPESLYPEIASNSEQWQQWDKFGMLDSKTDLFNQAKPGSVEYLKQHPYLMVDTALFDAAFKYALLAAVDNLDENLDGLLIHSDNFQALNLLQERYQGQIKCTYIDPPYNTDASEIVYKNSYKHSSWLSLIDGRVSIAKNLLSQDAIFCFAIDDFEYPRANLLLQSIFEPECFLSNVPVRSNPHGRAVVAGFSTNHEFAMFFSASDISTVGRLPRIGKKLERYGEIDDEGAFTWINFRKTGADSRQIDRPKQFYPVYADKASGSVRIPELSWSDETNEWKAKDTPRENEEVVFPKDDSNDERAWSLGHERARTEAATELTAKSVSGNMQIYRKYRPNQDGSLPHTWWDSATYSATESGTRILKQFFGGREHFSYPKSVPLVTDCLRVAGSAPSSINLDFFAGSGTTGHAVIALNREDHGDRRYILIEQGEYFDAILKPRIQKVIYSAEWKDGKATAPQTGISHTFKVLKLESYEDTLNNLQLRRTEKQQNLFNTLSERAKEDYLLHYLLEIESRDSLLSVEQFTKPFDYKLKVAVDSAGSYEERAIDLVETFNYLIGLRVKHVDIQREQGFVSIIGWLPTGEKTLVLWRDVEKVNYETLNSICDKLNINPADTEFEIVYINGDHNIPSVFTSTEGEGGITKTLKTRQIEPEFLNRMFAKENV